MFRQLAAGIAACGLIAGSALAAESTPELDTFVVSGEQPGPGLWKISKGDHVMWVLASFGMLPKGMTWRTSEIEARVAESQEVLYAPPINIGADIGILRGLTLIPAALKASKIPEGRTLKDVLPADIYDKWLTLRLKYIGKDDDIERMRPALALEGLRAKAVEKNGLSGGPNVLAVVGELRRKHKVQGTRLPAVSRTVRVENPRGILKSAQKLQLPDVECFAEHIDKIEADMEKSKQLANAWARGDVQTLRNMHRDVKFRDAVKENCTYALSAALNEAASTDAANAKKMFDDAMWHIEQASVQAQIDWIAAARASIEKNKSTFAVLPVADVFRPDGHLEKLRALGYTVEGPK